MKRVRRDISNCWSVKILRNLSNAIEMIQINYLFNLYHNTIGVDDLLISLAQHSLLVSDCAN